jgi:hypothetical protein
MLQSSLTLDMSTARRLLLVLSLAGLALVGAEEPELRTGARSPDDVLPVVLLESRRTDGDRTTGTCFLSFGIGRFLLLVPPTRMIRDTGRNVDNRG